MFYSLADPHFSHSNIIKYCNRFFCLTDFERETIESIKKQRPNNRNALREFKISQESVDRMDQIIIDKINEAVQPNDTFYISGDFGVTISPRNLITWAELAYELKDYNESFKWTMLERYSEDEERAAIRNHWITVFGEDL